MKRNPTASRPDVELARSLAKLWPHREYESSAATGILCRIGLHHWSKLDVEDHAPNREVRFCFWCSKIRIDGSIYEG